MARVPLLQAEDLSPQDREIVWRRGNLYKALVNSPPFASRFAAYGFWLNCASQIEPRMQEIVILRVAFLLQSKFEWSAHIRKSIEGGLLSPDEITALKRERVNKAAFSAVEAAALQIVHDIVSERRVDDAAYKVVRDAYSDSYMVEFAGLIGMYIGLAHTIEILQIDLGPEQAHWLEAYPISASAPAE